MHPQVAMVASVQLLQPSYHAFVPGFPKSQNTRILTKALWSPAIPQESRLGNVFKDCMPPTACWGDFQVLGLIFFRLVGAITKHRCRGKDDVERCGRSCWTRRELQNMEKTTMSIDGNNTKVISSWQDGCVMPCVDTK